MPAEPRPPTPTLLQRSPTWLLSQANIRAHRLLSAALAGHDARGHEVRVLAALHEFGSMSQADLGGCTDLDPGDVTRTLRLLESDGRIDRTPDPTDRRRALVSITASGTDRLRTLEQVLGEVQRAVLEPLDEADRDALISLLRQLQPPANENRGHRRKRSSAPPKGA